METVLIWIVCALLLFMGFGVVYGAGSILVELMERLFPPRN